MKYLYVITDQKQQTRYRLDKPKQNQANCIHNPKSGGSSAMIGANNNRWTFISKLTIII